MDTSTAIIGTGYAVPSGIRTNDDPIFAWLRANTPQGSDLFTGYAERRVLAPDEHLRDLLVVAARNALNVAGSDGQDIDLLLGVASLSEYTVPSELAAVHQALALPATTLIIPIQNEFNNFNTALLMADAMIRVGRARKALIVCGSNWTHAVDYHTPQAISVGDGAGAVVVAPPTADCQYRVIDSLTLVDTTQYGGMYLRGAEVQQTPPRPGLYGGAYSYPYFTITPKGLSGFKSFGAAIPQQVVLRLLARHGVHPEAITLVTHQASAVLMDAWAAAIKPAVYLSTIATFGNLTAANIPATLAAHYAQATTEYLVLVGIGVEMQTNAILLQRTVSA